MKEIVKTVSTNQILSLSSSLEEIPTYIGIKSYNKALNKVVFLVKDSYSEADETMLMSFLSSHNEEEEEQKQKIINKYKFHKENGDSLFEKIRADIVIKYQQGEYSLEEIRELEEALSPCESKIRKGDWLTGKISLERTFVGGLLTEEFKASLLLSITNYINKYY